MNVLLFSLLLTLAQEGAPAEPDLSAETLIDIDVREADAQDVLRLLAEVGGFNLAVDPGVSCKATLKLKQVPWSQVLDLVLRSCGLEQEILGSNLVRVARSEELRKEYEARRKYQEEKDLAGALSTTYMRLAYAKARDMAPMLEKFLSARGSVVFDERTNTLIITDIRR
ncbi:MAG: secretin N-terminal domain-containing protein [Vicinamibacteria bacterium]